MIVICNSSPLIALASVGLFDLLATLYEANNVPRATPSEFTRTFVHIRALRKLIVGLSLLPSSKTTTVLSKLIRI